MTLLLVTGAGASRNLGDGSPMPLMRDWSNALCEALDAQETNLASACHLTPNMDGPEFEKNLGLLLRWEQMHYLEERFQGLGGPQAGSHTNHVVKTRNNIKRRLEVVLQTVNTSLYGQFDQRRVNDDRATAAYGALLRETGDTDLIFATTNYDRAGETALETLGLDVDPGFRRRPNRTPTLEPTGLVANRGSNTPVIHLHGAVGWYEHDGAVSDHNADLDFNSSLGRPVVLYPDPDKDPTSDATVQQLWTEFHAAVDLADAILVIGHSLHDPALVNALAHASKSKPVVISYFTTEDANKIEADVPRATRVEMNFGPEIEVDIPNLSELLKRGSIQPV